MMQDTFPETWADTFALLCSIPVFAFTFIYGVRVRWYKSLLGVALFSLFASFSALFGLILTRRFIGDFEGYQTIAAGVYTLLFLSFSFFFAIFIVERRRGKETLPVPIGRLITGEIKLPKEEVMSNVPSDTELSTPIRTRAQLRAAINNGAVNFGAAKAVVGAVAAGVVAGLSSFVLSVGADSAGGEVVTQGEWANIAIAVIVGAGLTGGGVFVARNSVK